MPAYRKCRCGNLFTPPSCEILFVAREALSALNINIQAKGET